MKEFLSRAGREFTVKDVYEDPAALAELAAGAGLASPFPGRAHADDALRVVAIRATVEQGERAEGETSHAVDRRLRLYPNPTADRLRAKLAKLHRCRPENIIVGNGSDELLAMAVRAFVEPSVGTASRRSGTRGRPFLRDSKSVVQYFSPSYSLYPVLADIHGAVTNGVAIEPDFSVPALADLEHGKVWDFHAALTFVTTPNAPSGRGYATHALAALCRAQRGVVVLDEAYVDFADENALRLALKYPHVLVARTFSKAYSLCFQRVGYFVGHPELIAALQNTQLQKVFKKPGNNGSVFQPLGNRQFA